MSDHHGRCGCDTYVTQNKTNKKKVTIQIFDKATSVKTIYMQSSGTCIPSHVPALVHYILDLNPSNRLRRDSFDCESIQSCNSPGEEKNQFQPVRICIRTNGVFVAFIRVVYGRMIYMSLPHGHRHLNHPPIDHPYICHENTNHSRIPQLSKAPIHTSKFKKYIPNLLQA